MKIFNYTPHTINLFSKYKLVSFPSEGIARIAVTSDLKSVAINDYWTEKVMTDFVTTQYGDVEGLPDPRPDTYYIVSAMVRNALPERKDLLSPFDLVRDDEGRVVGCRAFEINP